jgi:hypothetical protein
MPIHDSEDFTGRVVELDGNEFHNCSFTKCRLVYRGGGVPALVTCQFDRCAWEFEDAAGRTLEFLRGIYHGMNAAGRELVERSLAG